MRPMRKAFIWMKNWYLELNYFLDFCYFPDITLKIPVSIGKFTETVRCKKRPKLKPARCLPIILAKSMALELISGRQTSVLPNIVDDEPS